ncbi:hypothetical protein BN10_590024 [Phycicoccus elongatus Lp2]|uniref:Uncharacterized protein n=1 Tax=Phycicoccus elongatus Lp2 TaxID=1193181 RepID=N0E0U4_9MICO|nr:hypothetical protein BN10_590024 [Phycicoccus elongatus Lp2]
MSVLLIPGSASSSPPATKALFRTPLATDSTRGGESLEQVRARRGTIALSHQIIDLALNGAAGSQSRGSEAEMLWSLVEDIFIAGDATPRDRPVGAHLGKIGSRTSTPDWRFRATSGAGVRGVADGSRSRMGHRRSSRA